LYYLKDFTWGGGGWGGHSLHDIYLVLKEKRRKGANEIVAGDGGASRATTTSPIAFKGKRTKGKKRRETID
jgi:hypothetical protein